MTSPASSGEGRVEEAAALWSWVIEKEFENALAAVPYPDEGDNSVAGDQWLEAVAERVPGKTRAEVKEHYRLLVEDVDAIESGRIPIPRYVDDCSPSDICGDQAVKKSHGFPDRKAGNGGFDSAGQGKGASKTDQERRKGIPWTEEEHRLFLLGLEKYGKGDWRSISRNFVVSRTPTQVASHAQKYFIRANSMNRERRRSSIHDITSAKGADLPAPQGSIAAQGSANSAQAISSSMNHPQPPAAGRYGPPLGHYPDPGRTGSSAGTPVMLPPGHIPALLPVAYSIPPSMMYR